MVINNHVSFKICSLQIPYTANSEKMADWELLVQSFWFCLNSTKLAETGQLDRFT